MAKCKALTGSAVKGLNIIVYFSLGNHEPANDILLFTSVSSVGCLECSSSIDPCLAMIVL